MAVLGPDLLLDRQTHDLKFVDGDLVLSADVAQAVKVRTLFFEGEWFLDRSAGIPYFAEVFVKPVNLDLVATLFRDAIVNTPGVLGLTRFVSGYQPDTRTFTLDWAASTDEGEISDFESFVLG